ncbi:Neurogenic locus notch like protein 2 [Myotis brandtii]|uniref:Neurogenic locus notch like protein 2 n=1 Tax=Myotis brandtii TaxID=109478 RepID=S7Q911_MYOBR|nr:Neurogenic locus notch like protein 2 [Myotis brandtii]
MPGLQARSPEETPLFLAAREGSYETAKVLLDHFANRDITDHMDRLPRDIAQERMHHDIVRLLDEYNVAPSPPGSVLTSALSPVICGPNRSFLSLKHTPMGKKPRRPNAKSAVPTSLPNLAKEAKEAKGGRRKKSLSDKAQLSESSVTLSPVDSLESPHTYVSDTTSSPMITSPGLLQASPNPMLAAAAAPAPVHAQHALSFSNLREIQPLAHGPGTVLPSVSQLLSHHHMVPPGSGSAGSVGRLHPVPVPADWMNRMEMNESQYNEMFGMHSCSSSPVDNTPSHQLQVPEHPFLTPSPESPDQWSSSSPHSNISDWSEGISSPPTSTQSQIAHIPEAFK